MNFLVVASIVSSLQVPEPSAPADVCGTPNPVILEYSGKVQRRLRGDWEIPDIVALTYSTAWPDALVSMLEVLEPKAQVLLLLPQDAELHEVNAWLHSMHFDASSIEVAALGVDTGWVRDYGPLQTTDASGRVIWLDADYSSRPGDDVVPRKLAKRFDVPFEVVPEGLEGGALISNGRGLCISTVEAFDQNGISLGEIEATDPLLEQLGCQVLVLVPALARDQTKHADMFAQFFAPDTLALASFDAVTAPSDAVRMDQAAALVSQAAAAMGRTLDIVRIPHPPPEDETYFTYLNGLRVGESFLVPQYKSVSLEAETEAYETLIEATPGLVLLPIPSDDMIALNGAVHCVTLGLSLPHVWFASAPSPVSIKGLSTKHRQPLQRGRRIR